MRLMTLHRAKGLEFTHVFLPACEDGLFRSMDARASLRVDLNAATTIILRTNRHEHATVHLAR